MDLAFLVRPLAGAAGPAAALALGSFVAAMVTAGEDDLDTSPLATASSALLLVALFGIAGTAMAALARMREGGRGIGGVAVAVVGTVLVAGGTWTALFVMPALAAEAPEVLDGELAGIVVGYVASYLVFTVGWVWTGVALTRAGIVPRWLGVLVAVGGVLAFVPSPEPVRLLVIGVAASLLARHLTAPATTRTPEPAVV
ncbi:hypothetical protein [Blastococcus goldschmidtiae]|uniref:Yip1 domain-containing protein n=1 Tax=Blastococcus goldschmidtiae TaxID=3075546 RepID=A0ABU2K1V4_9ACTN|nr:hypothetical protein [Blastococcus sp. DSM 46792]MDT0274302.1 hypothetical protein [Blastococcus sp. DSM 46792]